MICIITGTNRRNSTTLKIAQLYAQYLTEAGQEVNILDLAQLPPDFASPQMYDKNGKPEAFLALSQQIAEADKFLFVIPEYNGSFPGVLKTFIDGLPYPNPMQFKKAALVGLSAGVQGAAVALGHWNEVLSYLNVNILGLRIKLSEINKHLTDGKITNEVYLKFIGKQVEEFARF
jgi:NAD(P)H-dependent FMN reductase